MSFKLWAEHYTRRAEADAEAFGRCATSFQEEALVCYDKLHADPMGLTLQRLNPEAAKRHIKRLAEFDHCFARVMEATKRVLDISSRYLATVKASLKADRTNTIARWDVFDTYRLFTDMDIARELRFLHKHEVCFEIQSMYGSVYVKKFALDFFMTMGTLTPKELDESIDYEEVISFMKQSRNMIFSCLSNAVRCTKSLAPYPALMERLLFEMNARVREELKIELAPLKAKQSELSKLADFLAEDVFKGFSRIPREGTTLKDVYVHVAKPMQEALKTVLREDVDRFTADQYWFRSYEGELIDEMEATMRSKG